jgi:LPS export ABC transporter protein LptC
MNHIVKVANEKFHWPLFLFFLLVIPSCDAELSEEAEKSKYSGPLRTLEEANIFHSDSGKVKAKVFAKKILYLENEDREAPDGFFTTFYEKDGSESATLEADYAYYSKEDELWRAQGNVIIQNKLNAETLRTEELFWDPRTGDVSTEKFVKIETADEIITGTGLEAKQDFSSWTIKKPEATFLIEEDEGGEEF